MEIKADNRRELWDLLCARAVYILKVWNMVMADSLFAVV